jgi:hypothetical protein
MDSIQGNAGRVAEAWPNTPYLLIPGNIPEEIKRFDQWVNWAGVWNAKRSKLNKPPMTSRGFNASSTDRKTWSTFDEALAAVGSEGIYLDPKKVRHNVTLDGVGLAGLEETDLSGIDLDHCLDPETGEINPAASQIVEELDSYTEITPSDTGLRIVLRGDKPAGSWSNNRSGATEIEVYGRGRFFTFTGRHLPGTPERVEDRQTELEAFMKKYAPTVSAKRSRRPVKKSPFFDRGNYVFPLEEFLEKHGVVIFGEIHDTTAEVAYRIVCPWVHEHTGGDESGTRIGRYPSGAPWFQCEHGHCADKRKWHEFREHFEPDCYKPWWLKGVISGG